MSWPLVKFEHLGEFKNGANFKASASGTGYPLINVKDITDNHWLDESKLHLVDIKVAGDYFANQNDIFFVRSSVKRDGIGLVGKFKSVPEHSIHCGFVIRFRPNLEKINSDFLLYLLKSYTYREKLKNLSSGAAHINLSQGALKTLEIPIPDLEEQKSIAQTIKRYDELIENNKRRIELLEDSARQLYKEWFVRFRFPGHEHIKIIDGMPEGWESCPASDALHINPRVSVEKGKEIVCVPMASLSESQMTVDKSAFEQRTNHTSVKFMRGDTLFARITPCLENGKTAFVYFLEEGEIACGSTEFVVLRGKKVSNQFTYLLAREESFRGNAIKSMIGSSGRQRVQPSCFDKYMVPIPPDYIQEQFDYIVSNAFEQIAVLAKQNEQLVKARDVLLPKLMSGEIAV